jgi:tRNA A-37 threonylcarbamoyl transferase component Bud32
MVTFPDKLGKYEIRRVLGSGAMAVVHEGWDAAIGRRVAIKTIRRDQLDFAEAEEMLARFRREAQAAGRLAHPNIVSIYEYGEDQGLAYIAMEYIEGRELKRHLDAGERFALPEIVRMMTQLLAALDAAHRSGVVHRDVKPGNIYLLPDGTIKVADFGIARLESSSLTQSGIVLGTPAYMSPEQFTGQPLDGRSDLFSAGVILYQFLTGEKPFTGSQNATIMHKVLKEDPHAPSELNGQVPRSFDALMRKALAKNADDRFQSGREFADALAAAATGTAKLVEQVEAATTQYDETQASAVPDVPSYPPRKRGAGLWVALFIAVALAGAAWWMLAPKVPPAAAISAKPSEPATSAAPPIAAKAAAPEPFDPVVALDRIFQARDRDHLVAVVPDKPKIRIGADNLRFRVTSEKGGHLYVLMVGSDRSRFNLIFPNAIDGENRIAPDRELALPRKGWSMTAAGPPGTNHFVAIVSEQPRDFAAAGLKKVDPFGEFPMDAAAKVQAAAPANSPPFAGKPVCEPGRPCSAAYGAATFSIVEAD